VYIYYLKKLLKIATFLADENNPNFFIWNFNWNFELTRICEITNAFCKDSCQNNLSKHLLLHNRQTSWRTSFCKQAMALKRCLCWLITIIDARCLCCCIAGFLIDFISLPVIAGFTSAASITIATGQVKSLLGITVANGKDLLVAKWRLFKTSFDCRNRVKPGKIPLS